MAKKQTSKTLAVDFGVRPDFPVLEERVLAHWQKVKAFEQSVEQRPADKPYVFYDGPPFATGMPHYGHLMSSITKDVIPRYWTMKGYRVERIWGWDCHGLPIENMIEKELKIEGGKKGIESMGIDVFNEACRSEVLRLDKEWEKIINRIGRWVDFEHNYKTMDTSFMESVWWAFKELYEKELVYQGRKVILFCPRCSTPLSNFEIAMDNSYKDVVDNSVTVKFKVKSARYKVAGEVYFLAWTTTPWTLIGNVGLAVAPDEMYVLVKHGDEHVILAKARLSVLKDDVDVVKEFAGKDLDGVTYEPLYTYLDIGDTKAHYVSTADFVSMNDGTGVVHTAAMYGEDDFQLALEKGLPLVEMLTDEGKFMDFVTPIAGQFFKKAEKWILEDLTDRGLLYSTEKYTHSYPHCYRCETPLYYTGVPAWFIDIQKIKKDLVAANEHINWYPDHLKHGRFGKGLETAPDWNISRSRYWGTPIPIWEAEDGTRRVIGSIEDLRTWAVDPMQVEGLNDIHRHYVDAIEVWVDEAKTKKGLRIPEVFDCWVESGSMPFASEHYPFENRDAFEARYPAQFITEYVNQTRAWFYTLHVMSVAVFGKHAFENSLTNGIMLAEDGQKMSKSKKNYPDPMDVVHRYGVDSMRLYIMSSSVMRAENMNFSEKGVDDIRKRVFGIMWNVFTFYQLYDDGAQEFGFDSIDHVMDRWLASRLAHVEQTYFESMEAYDVVGASRVLMEFVTELSTWWLRQSRDRLRSHEDNSVVLRVYRTVLMRWSLMMAPFAPFFTEVLYHNLVQDRLDSIHLVQFEDYGMDSRPMLNEGLELAMREAQQAVEKAHALRKEAGIKVRQPLASVTVESSVDSPDQAMLDVVAAELNVKQVEWVAAKELAVTLDTVITTELKDEGVARELVRSIQQERRKAGTAMAERITVRLPQWPAAFEDYIKEKVLADALVAHEGDIEIVRKS